VRRQAQQRSRSASTLIHYKKKKKKFDLRNIIGMSPGNVTAATPMAGSVSSELRNFLLEVALAEVALSLESLDLL
jgi:hypothetical protein